MALVRIDGINFTYAGAKRPALIDASLEINEGEYVLLTGASGCGKTTLIRQIKPELTPTGTRQGSITYDGVAIESLNTRRSAAEIGFVQQNPDNQIVTDYVWHELAFGLECMGLSVGVIRRRVAEMAAFFGMESWFRNKTYALSGGQKQLLNLAGALAMDPRLLILDEPTAVLTPQETEKLFAVMRNMKADGKSIVIITHKLHEVMEISDRVAVLRKGEYIGEVPTSQTNPQQLTDMMVGKATTLNIDRPEPNGLTERLIVKNLTVKDADGVKKLSNVSFTAYGGEILGIAGISGSGQRELLEAIAGLQDPEEGSSIMFIPPDKEASELVGRDPEDIYKSGVGLAFVPEDRFGMGLVGSMDLVDNIMLRSYKSGKSPIADRKHPRERANKIVEELEVVTPNLGTPLRRLSGGNVQKILVGREIAAEPSLLMTAYAVRGLDINTSYTIYHLLNEQKAKGAAVIYVGEDLDVLLELCDRIVVLCAGQVSGIVNGRSARKEEVGLLMTRLSGKENANE